MRLSLDGSGDATMMPQPGRTRGRFVGQRYCYSAGAAACFEPNCNGAGHQRTFVLQYPKVENRSGWVDDRV